MYNMNKVIISQKFINDMNKVIAEGNSDLSFGDGVDWFDEEVDTSSFTQASLFNYEQEQCVLLRLSQVVTLEGGRRRQECVVLVNG